MIEVSIAAGAWGKGRMIGSFRDVIDRFQQVSTAHGSHEEKFSVEGVVELEDDSGVGGPEECAGGDGEMVEIHAAAPPHLIDLACDVRQRPS